MAGEVDDEGVSKAKGGSTEAAATDDTLDGDKLSEGSPHEVPSVGSRLHGTGECKPCAWFWKPQGCQNGRECMHCHLCPRNAIKDRKKLHASVRKEMAQVPQQVELSGIMEAVGKEVKAAATDVNEIEQGKPSKGSALHGTGECKPCAWFWHPKGCQNAEDCEFCHFCPEGELKLRRKLKIQHLRDGAQAGGDEEESSSSPKYVTLETAKIQSGETSSITKPSDTGTKVLTDARQNEAQAAVSVGSAAHGTGECKPCAWFWKPGSCKNGKECLHCHLCPEGELRRKKNEKTTTASGKKKANAPAHLSVRQQLMFQNQVIQQQQEHLAHLQAQMFMQQHMMWAAGGTMGYPMDMNSDQYTNMDQDDDGDDDEEEEVSEVAS